MVVCRLSVGVGLSCLSIILQSLANPFLHVPRVCRSTGRAAGGVLQPSLLAPTFIRTASGGSTTTVAVSRVIQRKLLVTACMGEARCSRRFSQGFGYRRSGAAYECDGEGAQRGERFFADAGAAAILVERDVTDMMQSVFDGPVGVGESEQALGAASRQKSKRASAAVGNGERKKAATRAAARSRRVIGGCVRRSGVGAGWTKLAPGFGSFQSC